MLHWALFKITWWIQTFHKKNYWYIYQLELDFFGQMKSWNSMDNLILGITVIYSIIKILADESSDVVNTFFPSLKQK